MLSLLLKYATGHKESRYIARAENDHFTAIGFMDKAHVPSWKRFGEGQSAIELGAHKERGWLSILARETPAGGRGEKEVMLGLDPEEVVALRDFLNQLHPA